MSAAEPDELPARKPRRELVEAQIYEQATRLFAERGFAGTSLQDIADAMGMTRPALYYYVKNKDQLLARLVTEITEGPAADIEGNVYFTHHFYKDNNPLEADIYVAYRKK